METDRGNSWFSIRASAKNTADIRIYDEIGGWGVTARQFSDALTALGPVSEINLHIHSPGGDVFDGIAIYNLLKNHPARKTVYIDGLAASMASVIAMVGDTILMPENAMMMVHKPRMAAGGHAETLRGRADLLDKVEAGIVPAYTDKTGKSAEEIMALLTRETWMSGGECVAQGFADKVLSPVKAMARIESKYIEAFENMPISIKNSIVAPQENIESPSAPTASITSTMPASAPVAVDETAIRAQERDAQHQRVANITALFGRLGTQHTDLMVKCVSDVNCSFDQAKDALLAALTSHITPIDTTSSPVNNGYSHRYVGNGNITGDGVRASLMARAGFDKAHKENPYNGMTLRELARLSLTERGIGVAGYNPIQMVGLAFTHSTSDFGNILIDVAHKAILQGWEEAPETFEQWTKKGQLSDFKTAHRVGLGGFPSLRQVREGAEYRYVTTNDKQATIALATYGELFSITRQAIINDDLSLLTDVPMKLGRAAKATIADLVYAVLTGNLIMNTDGLPLFDYKHGNKSKGAIEVGNIDKARQMMRRQKEGDRHLNIRPAFMLVPTALEATANQVIRSTSVKGADTNAGIINPVQNFATVIAEPRLDDASATAWYLAAAKGTDTIEVAYLNGVDTPYIDQQQGFESDGVTTKVRIDAGVAPIDHRGLVYVDGK